MTTADEAWIQNSLARLEQLEQRRAQLANRGLGDQLAELDEEIRSLYETLEAVAGDDESAAGAVQDPPHAASAQVHQPATSPFGQDEPFAQSHPFAQSEPFAQNNAFTQGPAPFQAAPTDPSFSDGLDDDFEASRSKGPWVAIAIVSVLALGGGGWHITQNRPAKPAEQSDDDPKVISASEVPDDTQEPQVARGADVDRTEGTRFKEGSTPERSRSSHGSSARPARPSNDDNAKTPEKIRLDGSRDPLAGMK